MTDSDDWEGAVHNFCQQITSHLHHNSLRFCAGRILPSRVRFIFTATHSPQAPQKCNKGNPTLFEWPIFQVGTLSEFVSLPPLKKNPVPGLAANPTKNPRILAGKPTNLDFAPPKTTVESVGRERGFNCSFQRGRQAPIFQRLELHAGLRGWRKRHIPSRVPEELKANGKSYKSCQGNKLEKKTIFRKLSVFWMIFYQLSSEKQSVV